MSRREGQAANNVLGLGAVIKYIGSKRLLIEHLVTAIGAFDGVNRVLDLFSGTSRVGHALKKAGFEVFANDHLSYASTIARCYVEADRDVVLADVEEGLRRLSSVTPKAGYFTETFCEKARYFQPKNGARIDAMREEIDRMDPPPVLRAVLLTSLMEAADRVDSTTGVQMAYLKQWSKRSNKDLELRVPDMLPGPGHAMQLDAGEAAQAVDVDLVYLDPPYNQHSYMGNYHIWETLVRWDAPEAYGIAQKRLECRSYKSPFNSKKRIHDALRSTFAAIRSPYFVVSFNNEGHVSQQEMEEILTPYGELRVVAVDFPRYVGARIGIYNPSGDKVGRVTHTRNKELIYLVSTLPGQLDQVTDAINAACPPPMS